MRLIIALGLLLLPGISSPAIAQSTQEKEVQETIDTLFEGMLKSDSALVASAFQNDAIMQTIMKDENGNVKVAESQLANFLKSIQQAKPGILNEKLSGYEIKVDGELASAWTPYEFYIGEKFSHCGVNSFQLVETSDGWKIFHIVDTRRKDNCVK